MDDIDLIPNWRIDIFDNEVKRGVVRGILRNTNDADIVGDYVAYRKNVIVRYVRAPPLTPIQVWVANKSFEISKFKFNISESSNLRTSQGSFSAVSKPNFASKYSLESSR